MKAILINLLNPIVHFWLHHIAHCTEKMSQHACAQVLVEQKGWDREVGGVTHTVTCTWCLLDLAVKLWEATCSYMNLRQCWSHCHYGSLWTWTQLEIQSLRDRFMSFQLWSQARLNQMSLGTRLIVSHFMYFMWSLQHRKAARRLKMSYEYLITISNQVNLQSRSLIPRSHPEEVGKSWSCSTKTCWKLVLS